MPAIEREEAPTPAGIAAVEKAIRELDRAVVTLGWAADSPLSGEDDFTLRRAQGALRRIRDRFERRLLEVR